MDINSLLEKGGFFCRRYPARFALVTVTAILSAFAELLGVFSLVPFIAVLDDPASVNAGWYSTIFGFLDIDGVDTRMIFLGGFCLSSFLIATILRVVNSIVSIRFFQFAAFEMSSSILLSSIQLHSATNRSKIAQIDVYKDATSEVEHVIGGFLAPVINGIRSSVLLLVAIISLAIISTEALVGAVVIFGGLFALVYVVVKPRLKEMGKVRNRLIDRKNSLMRDMLTNADLVRLHALVDTWIDQYVSFSKVFSDTQSLASIFAQIPKLLIEFVVFGSVIVFLLHALIVELPTVGVLPVLGVFVYGGYRLMPAVQDIYASLVKLSYSDSTLMRLIDDYDLVSVSLKERPVRAYDHGLNVTSDQLEFGLKQIKLCSVNFTYPDSIEPTIQNCSFTLSSNECVGIIGRSGSGKSTLLGLITGLLVPHSGSRKLFCSSECTSDVTISYCPQKTNLIRGSIAENIAFGLSIDSGRIEQCLLNVGLTAEGFCPDDSLSEDGDSISGGQLQRLGLARAIYRDPDFLILDEVTSSLDSLVEESVVRLIADLREKGKGIVFVSHRQSSLQCCDRIVRIKEGRLVEEGDAINH